ncbi:MAG: hypothetical protein ABIG37_01635 [Nanoarchaeota archaeon]|nr:hypothetical protein [Nanoarchaeota archaeon]
MILKILGSLDILTAVIFWLFAIFGIFPSYIVTIPAVYLLIKGIFFLISQDIASIIDVFCAILIFASFSFALPKFLIILITLFLIQKGIFSLLS